MRHAVLLLGAALAGLLAGAIAHLPARQALALAAPADIAADGVRGSVWQGHAGRVDYGGPAPLTAVDWRLSPRDLLTGRLGVEAAFDIAGGRADVSATLARGGAVEIREAGFRGPAAGLVPLLPVYGVSAGGELTARVDSGRWIDGRFDGVRGRVLWEDAVVRAALPVPLGRVRAEIRSRADGDLRMTLDNRDGSLAIEGEGRMDAAGRYELTLRLRPGDDTAAEVVDVLERHAARDDGAFLIRDSGRLVPR